jgi:hypothetical protein
MPEGLPAGGLMFGVAKTPPRAASPIDADDHGSTGVVHVGLMHA